MDTGCIPPTVNFFQYTSAIAAFVVPELSEIGLRIETDGWAYYSYFRV